jgi:catechol 2,3-dioxygenase-like lactoylglutathione lyase family enzyme
MEVLMSSTQVSSEAAAQAVPAKVPLRFEVTILPVSDVDRAKAFYQGLGWRLDIDLVLSDSVRTVQFTPPHSQCSIQFGKGGTTAAPGSAQMSFLVVDNIDAARDDLISRGVEVSQVQEMRPPGFGSQGGRSYFARASFSDPDGNTWVLQEITTRLPGREWKDSPDVASLAHLLHETSVHHGEFEAIAPPHNWWDWYAAYAAARQSGSTQEEAAAAAGRYMADVKHVVVSAG